MQPRLYPWKVSPGAYKAMRQAYVDQCGLEKSLIELLNIRASQINGCAYCLVMHTTDARRLGESDERMHLLSAWREAPCFTERERSALAWIEAVTNITESHVADEIYEEVRKHFSEQEIVDLTMHVAAINSWNRIAIAFRALPKVTNVASPAHLVETG